ncbi:MAG: type II secretion system F family protein [Acidimicrobiales bacterium]
MGLLLSASWLIALVPWRTPARRLTETPHGLPERSWAVAGGPVWGAAVASVGLLVHPVVAAVVVAWPSWRRWSTGRRDRVDHRQAALRALPEAADLVGLGIGAGLSVRAAVHHAATWTDDPYRSVFIEALRRADAGETFASALDAAAIDLDPVARPLIGLLVAADADGGAVLTSLGRVSDEARHRRRTAAEVRARRLPVTMLLPLVLCVLPAFGLLAVAPLVLTALGDLDLGF